MRGERLFPIAALIITLFAASLSFIWWQSRPLPSATKLVGLNGCDDFLAATKLVNTNSGDYKTMDLADLRFLVADNTKALETVRTGLTHQCRYPSDYSRTFIDDHLQDMTGTKILAHAFCAEAELARLDGKPNESAASCLDAIRLGQESARGGLVINRFVGLAVEQMGLAKLDELSDTTNASLCRDIVSQLLTSQVKTEPLSETLKQERLWQQRVFGWKGALTSIMMKPLFEEDTKKLTVRLNATSKARNRAILKFAARACELETGHPPAKATDLEPAYLKEIPTDPETGLKMNLAP